MGTKKNPGKYDCYANAGPDEPMFVLLGRDRLAASLVALWAKARRAMGEDPDKVGEAEDCVAAMRNELFLLHKTEVSIEQVLPDEFFIDELRRRGYDIGVPSSIARAAWAQSLPAGSVLGAA